ncbi:MAG: dCTP deaminase [Nanobdellota archaeon]
MILTKKEIIKQISKNKIILEPYEESAIGPASIDLTLDNKLRVFVKQKQPINIKENIDYKKYTKIVDISKGYVLKQNELVMGITKEKITLPNNISGFLQSRSKFARIGLMSHITAPFIAPGISNQQVLEIYNAGPEPIRLIPGIKVCHLILQKCKGKAKYEGQFKEQKL